MRPIAVVRAAVVALLGLFCAAAGATVTVGEIARLEDTGGSVISGLGLVVGLNGTGDSGKDAALARPLFEYYKNNGNTLGSLDELKNAHTVALVNVTCTIPEGGWQRDDRFDVTVSAILDAKSLEGGVLITSPLMDQIGPNRAVYAQAQGQLAIESPKAPRVGRVRLGAQMVRAMPRQTHIIDSFVIVLNKPYAGYASASAVAEAITQEYLTPRGGTGQGGSAAIARALDDRTVRVNIPDYERGNIAAFIGDVLSYPINISTLKLPARIIYNQQSGKIVMTADVEISPVAITSADLTITTTVPPPVPTPENPLVDTRHWTGISPGAKEGEKARLQDLLNAFNQLNIPVADQITLLDMMSKAGKLHAELVID